MLPHFQPRIFFDCCGCCSVAKSCLILCYPMNCSTPGLSVHHCLQVCVNSCPLSQWCYPTTSSSVIPFSSCPQLFPASGSSQWVSSLHQAAKVLELQLQSFQWIFRLISFKTDWSVSVQSKGLSRIFSSTTVQKHQFFSTQPSLWFNIHTWLLEKPQLWL